MLLLVFQGPVSKTAKRSELNWTEPILTGPPPFVVSVLDRSFFRFYFDSYSLRPIKTSLEPVLNRTTGPTGSPHLNIAIELNLNVLHVPIHSRIFRICSALRPYSGYSEIPNNHLIVSIQHSITQHHCTKHI